MGSEKRDRQRRSHPSDRQTGPATQRLPRGDEFVDFADVDPAWIARKAEEMLQGSRAVPPVLERPEVLERVLERLPAPIAERLRAKAVLRQKGRQQIVTFPLPNGGVEIFQVGNSDDLVGCVRLSPDGSSASIEYYRDRQPWIPSGPVWVPSDPRDAAGDSDR